MASRLPFRDSQHEGSLALRAAFVGVGAGLQKFFDHGRASVNRGQVKRGGAFAIRGLHVRAGADQQVSHVEVVRYAAH